jgi:DNA-binding transcriptional MerR regulator
LPETEDRGVYSIGAVGRMLAIPASTLRAWEDRYGVLAPHRSLGSQRLYSRAQVEQLRYIKSQMDSGMSAADAHRLLVHEIERGQLPAPPAMEAAGTRPLILIAERDPYAASLAEYFLRTEGYRVVTALNAQQASLDFDEHAPDVVLIDLVLSGGAGFRLLADFASQGSCQILAVSAIDSADEALHLGASAFLRKPVDSLTLVSTVRDLLGTSALVRSAPPERTTTP